MNKQEQDKIKAEAVMKLIGIMIDAYLSGFTDRNHLNLSELYRIAQVHVDDNYGFKVPYIDDAYTKEEAAECGWGEG